MFFTTLSNPENRRETAERILFPKYSEMSEGSGHIQKQKLFYAFP